MIYSWLLSSEITVGVRLTDSCITDDRRGLVGGHCAVHRLHHLACTPNLIGWYLVFGVWGVESDTVSPAEGHRQGNTGSYVICCLLFVVCCLLLGVGGSGVHYRAELIQNSAGFGVRGLGFGVEGVGCIESHNLKGITALS